MRMNLPTVLTILRLIAAPLIAVLFAVLPRPFADWAALLLFTGAAATDWLDGKLARAWRQETKLGAMLDPIADKAMVLIALMVLVAYSSFSTWIAAPAALIVFREVFVSGLREYLGDTAGTLKVTRLAKWKTAAQMLAITILLSNGLFEHYAGMLAWGMDQAMVEAILSGAEEDVHGLKWRFQGMQITGYGGTILFWIAALLTLITGWDYFAKARPHLREDD